MSDTDKETQTTSVPEGEAGVVTFPDGAVIKFTKTSKMKKVIDVAEGKATLKLYFRDGDTRTYTIDSNHPLLIHLAAHGTSQKVGDGIASNDTLEDAKMSVDRILGQLTDGTFNMRATGKGKSQNLTMLAEALMRAMEWDEETAREKLKNMSDAMVKQVKLHPSVAHHMEAIKAERAVAKAEASAKKAEESSGKQEALEDLFAEGADTDVEEEAA